MKTASALLMLIAGLNQGVFQVEAIATCLLPETTCYGSLGQTVYLQMSKITGYDLSLYKNNNKIFTFRKSKSSYTEPSIQSRWLFYHENGTMSISSAQRTDSGFYRVEIYDQNGKLAGEHKAQLTIEASLDTPVLSQLCNTWNRTVNCSSNGDSPNYSWSLNGEPLSRVSDQIVLLNVTVTGKLACNVSNHVSSRETTMWLSPCYDTQTVPATDRTEPLTTSPSSSLGADKDITDDRDLHWWIYYVIIPASASLLLLAFLMVCVCRKRKTNRTEANSTEMEH